MGEQSGPGELDATLRQGGEAAAASQQQSLPAEAVQHREAPRLAGYLLTSPVGRGAFAQVWRGRQTRTGKWVAVKVFTRKDAVDWALLKREVERLIRLDKHPHIVSLLDADMEGETPYYVMDLLTGGSLERYVDPACPAPVDKAARWMEEIAKALAYVHSKGIIHCDLKPANVLLDEEGRIRVADFGQARAATESSGALGTLFYMAPEQADLPEPGDWLEPDMRWDLYGLGATMHAVLTGRPPHGGPPEVERLAAAGSLEARLAAYRELVVSGSLAAARPPGGRPDEDLAAIIGQCLRVRPEERYATASQVEADLAARRQSRPVGPLASRRGYRARKFVRRNVALSAALAVGACALIGAEASLLRKGRDLRSLVAQSYLMRAEVLDGKGKAGAAAVYAAESDRLVPSRAARMSALAYLQELVTPSVILAHPDMVGHIRFSPDGKLIVTGGWDGKARLWAAADGSLVREFVEEGGKRIVTAAFSPDGARLITASEALHSAGLWDTATGKLIVRLEHENSVWDAAFSPDGKTVLTGSWDKTARLWDADTGKPVGAAMAHGGPVRAVAFSPDGLRVLTGTGGEDHSARLWDVRSGRLIGKPMAHSGAVVAVAFSSNGTVALSAGEDGTARLWDAGNGKPITAWIKHGDRIEAAALSPDGRSFLTAGSDDARLWDAATGSSLGRPMPHEDRIHGAAFSPDGTLVATASQDHTVRLWDARSGEPLGRPMRHGNAVALVAFSPDGGMIASGGADRTARLWKVSEVLGAERTLRAGKEFSRSSFSPDGKAVLTVDGGEAVLLWSFDGPAPASRALLRGPGVDDAVLSPDGKTVLTRSTDRHARLWDASTGAPLGRPMRHQEEIYSSMFSPDGSLVLTTSLDHTARLWDSRTGEPAGPPLEHPDMVGPAAFSPDGKRLVTGAKDGARVWDARAGKSIGRLLELDEAVQSAAFSPDGKTVIAGSTGKTARLWGAATGEPIGPVLEHGDRVVKVAFGPDGRLALTVSYDHTARLWDARTGKPVGGVMRHSGTILDAAFSPDGRAVATCGTDKTVRFWDGQNGAPIGRRLVERDSVYRVIFSPDGRGLLTETPTEIRLWSLEWLHEDPAPEELRRRALLASQRRLDTAGELEAVPMDEWAAAKARAAGAGP